MANDLAKTIDDVISSGTISQSQYEALMTAVYAGGEGEESERSLASKLFAAVSSGKLKVIDIDVNLQAKDEAAVKEKLKLEAEKKRAIEEDEQKLKSNSRSKAQEDEIQELNQQFIADEVKIIATPVAKQAAKTSYVSMPGFRGDVKTRRESGERFQLLTDRMLDVNLNGRIWMKPGCMTAYYGLIKFTREGIAEFGISKMLKRAITGEGTILTKATGQGNLLLSDLGKKISIVELQDQSLIVNGSNLLAFDDTVAWDITYLNQLAAIWAGGFFQVKLAGPGFAAITTYFDPIILRVNALEPLMTDVKSTVAWSAGLTPQIKTDVSMRTLIGLASGETVHMRFEGDGFVIVQPYDETAAYQQFNASKTNEKK